MKVHPKTSLFAALIAFPVFAQADWFKHDQPPTDAKPLSELIKIVEKAGYNNIVEVEFEDGVYEIETIDGEEYGRVRAMRDENGKEIEIKIDPLSGEFTEA